MSQISYDAQTQSYNRMMVLPEEGWEQMSLGKYKSGSWIKELQGFDFYIRKTNLDDILKKSSKEVSPIPLKPAKIKVLEMGSDSPMGNPKVDLTPNVDTDLLLLPQLGHFELFPSLVAARPNDPCLLIGYDSEWSHTDTGRNILSWQFALIHDGCLMEIVFIKTGDKDLNMTFALGVILDQLGYESIDERKIRRYSYCAAFDESDQPIITTCDDYHVAKEHCVFVYREGVFTHEQVAQMPDRFYKRRDRDWAWFHTYIDYSEIENPIKICLLCHTGLVDISAFHADDDYFLRLLTEVQGGLVSLSPIKMTARSHKNVNNASVYGITLSVADTMCHAPAGRKSLKSLGEAVGIHKVDIPVETKEHMDQFLHDNPVGFMEYASTDSVVTLMYASALYGYNNTPPITVTSATAKVMKGVMMEQLRCNNTESFNRKYRGLESVRHGKVKLEDRPGFVEATSLEPISDKVNTIQHYASHAYHGGYNSCSEIGFFPKETYDYDLKNAYPTAMCLVPDIDWEDPIRYEIRDKYVDIRMWQGVGGINPIVPFVGYVRFEFPNDVKYPCIPVNVDGVPAYPRTSNGLAGVYVAGPFIYLALKLGAKIYCETGYFLNTIYDSELRESRSLATAVKQLVVDRNLAKQTLGKGSLEELILKTMVNSGYGKNAQNVIQKSSWSAFKDIMEVLGCSSITNPVSAMMITSIVQCELLAAQNQCYEKGYMTCSVTTDGFISDCPQDVLKSLDLHGFRKLMEQSRLFLTDGADPDLWEIKHAQDDLVNFTTRGNVSLHCKEHPYLLHGKEYPGVCAHNSTKSGYESDSYEDRLWLMTQVLKRTGTVDYTANEWSSFKSVVKGEQFRTAPVTRHIRMDFDMKRKPIRDSIFTMW